LLFPPHPRTTSSVQPARLTHQTKRIAPVFFKNAIGFAGPSSSAISPPPSRFASPPAPYRQRLEEQGLVVEKQDAEDHQTTLLSATAAGKKLLMQGRARRVRGLAKQIAALSREQRAALKKASKILKEVLRAI
jgi:hypothetical protein